MMEDIEESGMATCLYPKRIPTAATSNCHRDIKLIQMIEETFHSRHQPNKTQFTATLLFLLILKLSKTKGQIESVYDKGGLFGVRLSHAPHLEIKAIRMTIGIQNLLNRFCSQSFTIYQQAIQFENAMGNWLKRATPQTYFGTHTFL